MSTKAVPPKSPFDKIQGNLYAAQQEISTLAQEVTAITRVNPELVLSRLAVVQHELALLGVRLRVLKKKTKEVPLCPNSTN